MDMTLLPYLLKQANGYSIDSYLKADPASQNGFEYEYSRQYAQQAWDIVLGAYSKADIEKMSKEPAPWAVIMSDIRQLSQCIAAARGDMEADVVTGCLYNIGKTNGGHAATRACLKHTAITTVMNVNRQLHEVNGFDGKADLATVQGVLQDYCRSNPILNTLFGKEVLNTALTKPNFNAVRDDWIYMPGSVYKQLSLGVDQAMQTYENNPKNQQRIQNAEHLFKRKSNSNEDWLDYDATFTSQAQNSVEPPTLGGTDYLTGGLGGALALAPLALMSKNPLLVLALGGLLGGGYQYGRGQGWWKGFTPVNSALDKGSNWMKETFGTSDTATDTETPEEATKDSDVTTVSNASLNPYANRQYAYRTPYQEQVPTPQNIDTRVATNYQNRNRYASTTVHPNEAPQTGIDALTNRVANNTVTPNNYSTQAGYSTTNKAPTPAVTTTTNNTTPKTVMPPESPQLQEVPQLV